ncbi:von Willebrand factor C and EGF domain-containing protein-like isoform X2 [Cylas formicarius]|uniref:von Willebrand factor C and EGF domain-containing protein-like isoform X2 n=1 Tax=Cylas formicarius TaxID=197179 RepID=UPI002958A202|nr:von Willebrand factor C and EGF domain-containing protein-like isoform X2 [Cylas formicarius]
MGSLLPTLAIIIGLLNIVSCDTNCDTLGILLYEDLGCKPVKTEGQDCPEKFECDLVKANQTACMFKGRTLNDGDEVDTDLTYSSCNVGCHCRSGEFTCAILDCPEWLGLRAEPNCYLKHELGKCCSTGQICSPPADVQKCKLSDTESYNVGQQFSPRDTCLSCVCPENFSGKLDEKACARRNCAAQLRHSADIEANCAPAYFKYGGNTLCCPDAWLCPSTSDKIEVVNSDAAKGLECNYGNQKINLGEGFHRKINQYGQDRDIQCECSLPPLLTCKEK